MANIVILPEAVYDGFYSSEGGMFWDNYDAPIMYNSLAEVYATNPDTMVVVEIDGVRYDCKIGDIQGFFLVLGDSAISGFPNEVSNGEPFYIIVSTSGFEQICIHDGTATEYKISVYVEGEDEEEPTISTGKTFLLHQMFGKVFANAMTGKWFWFGGGSSDVSQNALVSADGYTLTDKNGTILVSKE